MKKKKACVVAALGIVICVAVGTGFYFYRTQKNEPEIPALPEGMSLSEDVVSATGLTSVGMSEETCELGFLEDGIYVEETYLNMGDEVEAGTAVFKVSEESLESARRELEKQVQETALNRRQGAITYENGLLDAQKEKELAAVEASYAQSIYDNAVLAAQDEVDALQLKVEEAQEKVDEYTASIEEDYYYTYYEVAKKEATWKENAAFLMELYEEWNVEWLQDMYKGYENGTGYVTNQVTASGGSSSGQSGTQIPDSSDTGSSWGGSDSSGAAPGGSFSMETVSGACFTEDNVSAAEADRSGSATGQTGDIEAGMEAGVSSNVSDDSIRYNIYLSMEAETEESEQAYETALENYENAKRTAAAGIEEAKSELAVLQAQLKEQQTAYEKAMIEAKLTYELAISGQENAQMVYESTVKQLEEEYETLREEEETAAENLALFEETLGDGVFYTSSAGTVMMTAVRASQWITEDTVVIAYSNPDTVTISAFVDQADIASVEIGQEAFVLISGYGSYMGKVTSIDPVSSSGDSSVSYTVNVQLEGDVSALEANLTVYVYLGLTEEEQEMMSGSMGGRSGKNFEEGSRMDSGDGGRR